MLYEMRSDLKNIQAIVGGAIVINNILLGLGDSNPCSSCEEGAFQQIQRLRDMEEDVDELPSNENEFNRSILMREIWKNRNKT